MKAGQIAKFNLGGEVIKVGIDRNEFPWLQTSENIEPIYMNVAETKLLIAGFRDCCRGEYKWFVMDLS